MRLNSIEIQGFKSFADKTVLKFGKGITAVVGPNGSGKSNINDAVRWVLGEQSTKNLRGQSMEDVIFGGTAERRPHGYCEVTLNIDNTDRTLNFDNDSVSITRRYYRSHESEYLINNVSVRLKDINELFMDTGIGRDGYSIIGQGKIDSIISSKSDERRDIFEEASGISKYRYRKIEAERKLKAAEDNLVRLKDIMNELEDRVGPLKTQSEKAKKFLELSSGRKELEIGLWLYALSNSRETIKKQDNKITAAEYQYSQIEKRLSELEEAIESNSVEFARKTSEIELIRTSLSEFDEAVAIKNGEIAVINNDIAHSDETAERLRLEIAELEVSDQKAYADIEAKKAESETLKAEAEQLKMQADTIQLEFAGLLTDSDSISRQIEEKNVELNAISAEIADKRVIMVTAKSAIDEIADRAANIDEAISQASAEVESLSAEFKETEELIRKLDESITECANALKGYELRYNSRKQSADEAKEKVDSIKLDIESKKRKAQILSDLEKNMDGFSHAVKSVVKEVSLKGVCGPVSRIISVDSEYSVAIETALGAAMQHVVVETESDGKRAIAFLKNSGFGRATFLPISSLKPRTLKDKGAENMFGFVDIAANLVRCEDKYKNVIGNLLGNTVIAEDLDSAVNIAKKFGYGFKVVSLDGQVVNTGGSLTGGSLVKNAGLLSRAAEINKLNTQVKALEEKLQRHTSVLNDAVASYQSVEADILNCKSELTTSSEDKIRAEGELKRIGGLKSAAESTLKSLNEEKQNGTERTAVLSVSVSDAAAAIAELDNKKAVAEAELNKMTGGRDNISAKRDELTDKITALRLQMTEKLKDSEAAYAYALSIESAISDRSGRIEQYNEQIALCAEAREKLALSIAEIEKQIDELRRKASDNNNRIESLISERNEVEKSGHRMRAEERETTSRRETVGGELARLQERKETMLAEYDNIIKQMFDEYQLTRTEAEALNIDIGNPADAKRRLAEIKSAVRSLGSVNVSAIEEYKEVSERYEFMKSQIDDVDKSRAELYKLIGQLTQQMKEMFLEGFSKIGTNFSKTFTDLFGGGTAQLVLTDPDNVLDSGIDIVAKLPGKNVPSLAGLSGGEKAMTALSIYFAIMRVSPPPFCFLDEVDTALDDINVERFADYMKTSGFNTQFICVSHRRGTMEAADMLYGVTMQEKGVTKLLELNVAELEKKFNLEEVK